MASIHWTDELRATWEAWTHNAPLALRKRVLAFGLFPNRLYRLGTTGQRVTIASYDLNDTQQLTVTVTVPAAFNVVLHEHQVSGVAPGDLEECDLPAPDEMVGAALADDEIHGYVERVQSAGGPDAFNSSVAGQAALRDIALQAAELRRLRPFGETEVRGFLMIERDH